MVRTKVEILYIEQYLFHWESGELLVCEGGKTNFVKNYMYQEKKFSHSFDHHDHMLWLDYP